MNPSRKKPQISRKKACQNCVVGKVRCGLEKPVCSRCRVHSRQCRYPETLGMESVLPESPSISAQSHDLVDLSYSGDVSLTGTTHASPLSASKNAVTHQIVPIITPGSQESLNFDQLNLMPMLDAEDIRYNWMRSLISPMPEQMPKIFHPFTLDSISCILQSYPGCILNDRGIPPIIHPMQLSEHKVPETLANCFSLVRLWQNRVLGSDEMVASMIKQEIHRLVNLEPSVADFELLCSFQAYLIYMIVAYFSPIGSLVQCDGSSMITLQEIAFRTAKAGVICREEVSQSLPSWESWIIASTKRRCLFVMYIFSNLYHARQGVPNFVANELKGMYVPEGKELWGARDRRVWEKEYRRHISQWQDGMLEISELWVSPETGSENRRSRIARWLQSTDEFGMMLFMTAAHIHGC